MRGPELSNKIPSVLLMPGDRQGTRSLTVVDPDRIICRVLPKAAATEIDHSRMLEQVRHKPGRDLHRTRLLSDSRSVQQPDADKLCWAKPNLIIGPLGNHRMFDAGDEIDFESPIGIKGARQLNITAMVELGKPLKAYTARQIESKEVQRRFHIMLEACKKQTIGNDITKGEVAVPDDVSRRET